VTNLHIPEKKDTLTMPDILHMIGIRSPSPDTTYKALTTRDGLAGWWTETTDVDGDTIRFRFGGDNGFDMKVLEAVPSDRVCWEVVEGPEEWVGTKIGWQLRQKGDYTMVIFKHEGWREPVEFMHFCSTKWATFLLSLRFLVETGNGAAWRTT
jgi:Activator of Hsp90 ATPase homolog 1-like protein